MAINKSGRCPLFTIQIKEYDKNVYKEGINIWISCGKERCMFVHYLDIRYETERRMVKKNQAYNRQPRSIDRSGHLLAEPIHT